MSSFVSRHQNEADIVLYPREFFSYLFGLNFSKSHTHSSTAGGNERCLKRDSHHPTLAVTNSTAKRARSPVEDNWESDIEMVINGPKETHRILAEIQEDIKGMKKEITSLKRNLDKSSTGAMLQRFASLSHRVGIVETGTLAQVLSPTLPNLTSV